MAHAFEEFTLGLGVSIRTETAADKKNYNVLQNNSLFAQVPVKDSRWLYHFEYNLLKKESREGTLAIKYNRHEIQNWGMWRLNPGSKTIWTTGLGLNISQERVTSKLVGTKTSRSIGDPYLSSGLQLAVARNFFEVVMAQLSFQHLQPLAREEKQAEGVITFRLGYKF